MKHLIKSSAPHGHRRAGLFITPEGVEAELSAAQLSELRADPRIVLGEARAQKTVKDDGKGDSK